MEKRGRKEESKGKGEGNWCENEGKWEKERGEEGAGQRKEHQLIFADLQPSPNAGFKLPIGREGSTTWRGEEGRGRKERGRQR